MSRMPRPADSRTASVDAPWDVRLTKRLLAAASGRGIRGRVLVFSFHRVLPKQDPLLTGEPDAQTFGRWVDWIRSYLNVLKLPEAVALLERGELPPRSACITFDDGYRNNFEVACPLLEHAGLPATFFIAAGAVDHGAMWNDLVIEAVRACGDSLDLRDAGGGVWEIESEAHRPRVVAAALDTLKYLPLEQRSEIAEGLYQRHCSVPRMDLMMTRAMVKALAERGHDVGAHTVSHPILQNLAPSAAREEIESSREWVREVTGCSPLSFAYPNGRKGIDFTELHMSMVETAGFRCAASTTWGCVTARSNPFALERFSPWEFDRSGFVSRMLKTYVRSYLDAT